MEVVSLSPLRASGFVWQAHSGAHAFTVVVKATFTLQPGECPLAPEQEPVSEADEHWDDDSARGVVAPSDRVPYKLNADVMLVGHAYAPGMKPARSVVARLAVAELDKSIEVWCDRAFRAQDGQLVEGPRFAKMPLRWERAAAGADAWNPAGLRFDAPPDAYGTIPVPNLQPVGASLARRSDTFPPVCFGPIAASWPGRVRLLGRAAGMFPRPGWEERPLPEGMDPAYFQAAPPDQVVTEILPHEQLVLEHLHPEHPQLVTRLPGLSPRAVAERATGEREEVSLVADTLWIDTDRGLCTVVWRGRIGLRHAGEAGRISVTRAHAEVLDPGIDDDTMPPSRAKTMIPFDIPSRAEVMPFLRRSSPESAPFPSAPASAGGLPFAPANSAVPAPYPSAPVVSPSPMAPPGKVAPPAPTAPPVPMRASVSGVPSAPAVAPVFSAPSMAAPVFSAPPAAAPVFNAPPTPVASSVFQAPPAPVASVAVPAGSPWAGGVPGAVAVPRETIGAAVVATGAAALLGLSTDRAAQEGAAAASTAAAGAAPWSPPRPEVRPAVVENDVAPAEPAPELLQLLWYDAESISRMRRVPPWKQAIADLERGPRSRKIEVVDGAREPWEVEDRREVLQIMARAPRTDGKGVEGELDRAIGDDGKFIPPLVLLGAEVEMPFDELEELKATMSAAAPLVTPADEGLKVAVGAAKEFVQLPGLAAAPAVSEALTARIREAFAKEKKALPADHLSSQAERVLLSGRHYQRRDVLGGRFFRCLLHLPDETEAIVGYLPEEVGKKLPMWKRFRARLIAEVHPAQDQYESLERAVKILGVARLGGAQARKPPAEPRGAGRA